MRSWGTGLLFVGKVGKDFFGEQLRAAITEVGINADNLYMDAEVHTTLALVHTYPGGDRDFSFYRNPGADMMLKKEEVNVNTYTTFKEARLAIFEFIESWYNNTRIHGSLGYKTPNQKYDEYIKNIA